MFIGDPALEIDMVTNSHATYWVNDVIAHRDFEFLQGEIVFQSEFNPSLGFFLLLFFHLHRYKNKLRLVMRDLKIEVLLPPH